ncbi:MAG TPA: substrate-binding domain-containing protein [Minicystis sp.]|nr:substrate-binding domain-containing protein [Minicystis sp.]
MRAALAAALGLALAACAKPDAHATGKKHKGTAEDPFVVGMSQCNLGEPWRVQMNEDLKAAAAKHPELKLVFKDAQNESLTQRAQLEELVDQGIDLLLVSPKESAPLTKPVADVYKKGIPVIVLDRAVEGDQFSVFIGGDNKKIGRAAGEWVLSTLGGKGKIVELEGLMTSTPAQDRHEGFLAGLDLAGHPELKIVFTADMRWLEPEARKEMASALATQPEIDLVYAHNDPGAHGAYLAAKEAGRAMKFVGIDALPHEGVEYVKEGILDATFRYPTGGAEAIETAVKLLHGEGVPRRIVLGTRRYTKQNVAAGGEAIP